jgi:hypothetical protein
MAINTNNQVNHDDPAREDTQHCEISNMSSQENQAGLMQFPGLIEMATQALQNFNNMQQNGTGPSL